MKPLVSHERLRALLRYNRHTGAFTWLQKASSNTIVGTEAGCLSKGYRVIRIDGRLYRANRLAWFYVTGVWPEFDVDHRDTDPGNNRWRNLRDVPHAVNNQNLRRPHRDNEGGLLGTSKIGSRWRATIGLGGGKTKHLGCFASTEAAHAAYVAAKRSLHEGNTL